MTDNNIMPPAGDADADLKKTADKHNQTREERLRAELRKNLRRRKGHKE